MDKKVKWWIGGFFIALVLIVIGIGEVARFWLVWLGGGEVFYPVIVMVVGSAAFFLLIVKLLVKLLFNNEYFIKLEDETKKSENQDKLYEKDGWEYLGEGCYCPTRFKDDRDWEKKRRAESKAYMEKYFPKNKENK